MSEDSSDWSESSDYDDDFEDAKDELEDAKDGPDYLYEDLRDILEPRDSDLRDIEDNPEELLSAEAMDEIVDDLLKDTDPVTLALSTIPDDTFVDGLLDVVAVEDTIGQGDAGDLGNVGDAVSGDSS